MADLSVKYMGLDLSNPLIVSSSSLTGTVDKVKRCEDSGAGAVVLKSLFEEQIESEAEQIDDESWPYPHPEAFDYMRQMGMRLGQDEYLKLVEGAVQALSIPVIASLNCVSPRWWNSYAEKLAGAGAAGLELNISIMPRDYNQRAAEIEKVVIKIVESISKRVDLPIAVKIGPYFTSLPNLAVDLRRAGAEALVLFNRFYQFDIDIDKIELASGYRFSSPHEIHLPLRWIAILYSQAGCDLSASTGVHDGSGVVKQLLAGAAAVQICSTLYINGLEQIGKMIKEVKSWMDKNNYNSIADFKGKLSQGESENPEFYERFQYIKALVGIE